MREIYIDLLVIINLYITYFLLRATAVFLKRKVPVGRILAASLAGGVTSLLILLPPLGFVLNMGIKIAAGTVIVLIAFGSGKDFAKNALVFIIINVVFAGFALMLHYFAAPLSMEYNNGFTYFDISFPLLIITTAAAYALVRVLRYILDGNHGDKSYTVTILRGESSVTLDALADSGNMLVDYFTGNSVIICPYARISAIAPAGVLDKEPPVGIRLLPYNTIDSSGLIPTFKADSVIIKSGDYQKSVIALIGVAEKDAPAIFNPKLLI